MGRNIAVRFLFLLGVLCVIFFNQHWVWSLIHLLYVFFLLYTIDKHKKRWLHTWRLLRWLLIPIIVLHLLFTPGEVIFIGYPLPLSYEGLQRGLWLALHFSEIYFAALLLGYVMPMAVWVNIILRFPYLREVLLPYLYLMSKMMLGIRVLVRREYKTWQLKGKQLAVLPNHISHLVSEVEVYSNKKAKHVWHSWDAIVHRSEENMQGTNWANESADTVLDGGMIYLLMLPPIVELGIRYL